MEHTLQGSVKKQDGNTSKQRVIVSIDGDNATIQTGVWKKNQFTNQITVTCNKAELIQILQDGE